jgi:hypothetical protein
MPGIPSMPTGVALTTPAAPGKLRDGIGHGTAAPTAKARLECLREAMSAVRVAVIDQERFNAEVEERESDGAACTPGANEKGDFPGYGGAPECLLESAPETHAIGVVAGRATIRPDDHGIDGPDLPRFWRHHVEQGQHRLLAWIGDVDSRKFRRSRRIEQALRAAPRQNIDVHEVIVAVAPGRAGLLLQRRRQGFLDIGSDQADQQALHSV